MIHPTAVVDKEAKIGKNVTIGPYAVIGPGVVLGDDNHVANHVTILGPTTIGRGNRFYSTCSIGQDPQDKKFKNEVDSRLEIGDHNTIREFVTINRGSAGGGGVTRLGHHNWIMAYCHIAHDCQVGSYTVMANAATLAGHVQVGDHVVLGGFTAVHQFCAIGEHTITGGHTMVGQDIPPFLTASGNRVRPYGINKVGLERTGFSPQDIQDVQKAYKIFYRSKLGHKEAVERIQAELGHSPHALRFAAFCRDSTRGVCR